MLRSHAMPVLLRAGDGTALADVARVLAAGLLAGGPIGVSVAQELPAPLMSVLLAAGVEVSVEDARAWESRLATVSNSGGLGMRVRILGPREEASARVGTVRPARAGVAPTSPCTRAP